MTPDAKLTQSFYVVGTPRSLSFNPNTPVVMVEYSRTEKGWKQRVQHKHASFSHLCVDYISKQTRDELIEWVVCDFTPGKRIFNAREEALEYLAQKEKEYEHRHEVFWKDKVKAHA